MPALLLTGRPGVGKTTIVRAAVARLGGEAGGFYTVETRKAGERMGFELVTLGAGAGRRATLARLDLPQEVNGSTLPRVGGYRVHVANLDHIGVAAVIEAVARPEVTVVVIDEIGRMEMLSASFCRAVEAALASDKVVLATVMAGPQPWVDAIKARPGVSVKEVTLANRGTVLDEVLGWLRAVRGNAVA